MWYQVFTGFPGSSSLFSSTRIDSVILLLGVIVLTFVLFLLRSRKTRKLPPGPLGLPVFGYYPFLKKNPVQTAEGLAKKYGNVCGFYLGGKYVVLLNDWKALKDALGQNPTIDRPPFLFGQVPYNFGVVGDIGAKWLETRRLSSKVMKDGLQKNHWEDLIQVEMSDTVESIAQEEGNPIQIGTFFSDSFSNIVIALVLGKRLHQGHPSARLVSESVDWILKYSGTFGIFNYSPTLFKFLQMLGIEEDPGLGPKLLKFGQFVSNTVDSEIQNRNSASDDSLIIRFQNELDSRKKTNQQTLITDERATLKGTVIGLLTGGSETTRTTMLWLLIAMADYPDKQKKVHEELDRVIGKEGTIRWSDRSKVPYTLAAILESMRWKTVVPFPAMRMASEDTEIQGYCIPKGTFVVTNNFRIHNDERYWENPDQFKPERFLLENGKKANTSADSYNPFSYGKRNCPGKLLALMQMLQYFSALMQKFKVLPKEGDKVQYEVYVGLSYQPENAELRFIPR